MGEYQGKCMNALGEEPTGRRLVFEEGPMMKCQSACLRATDAKGCQYEIKTNGLELGPCYMFTGSTVKGSADIGFTCWKMGQKI